MRARRWLRGSSPVFALAGMLPPFCGPLPGPDGHARGGSPGVGGAAPDAGTAGATGGSGDTGGVGGEAGALSTEPAIPDPVLGCGALPWSSSASFEILAGLPAKALGVSANGAVVVGTSGNQATIWDPAPLLLPTSDALSTPDVDVTNCTGSVFAGANARVLASPELARGFRQTRTSSPALLQYPPQTLSPDGNVRGESFTADGVSLVGYWHNGIGNWPEALLWDPSGAVSEPLGNYPHLALVVSPDGSNIAGRSDCAGALSCHGVAMFDWSATGETQFHPAGGGLAEYEQPALSHDRTTAAGQRVGEGPLDVLPGVVWFRSDGETVDIDCLTSCQPIALTSHGSVLLLGDGAVWTRARGLRSFAQFLNDADVVLPSDVAVTTLRPSAISDDGRVIVGSFGTADSARAFKLTLSRSAYR